MHVRTRFVLLLCLLACVGCNNGKSTDELIADLKSGTEIEGVIAARTLPRGKSEIGSSRFVSCRSERPMRQRSFRR